MLAALWKEENKQKPGPKTEGITAHRRAVITDISHPARAEAGEFFNVSRRKIDEASYVHSHSPDLARMVHQGNIALKNAYRQVKGPEDRKKIAATKPPQGIYQVLVIDPPGLLKEIVDQK